uniref:Uncharacterized protein n=1 Tax=Adineta vaga TaxID=104782 RepID=B3G4B9_ADIVA|nr:unknown [Adineta vaga]
MAENSRTIDLDRAERTVSSLPPVGNNQQKYRPKTIKPCNLSRQIYLPIFPTKSYGQNNSLLLANVPGIHLSPAEKARRQHGADTKEALTMMKNYKYSDGYEGFHLSEEHAKDLANRFQIGESIIIFNADRIRGICSVLFAFHEEFRLIILEKPNNTLNQTILNSKEMTILLEFYLQIDVDTFYMKICSLRPSDLLSTIIDHEGLFSEYNQPEARYSVVPCNNLFCSCCHPPNTWRKTRPWSVIDFVSSPSHQFINGYTTYLNCSAVILFKYFVCNTSNIIYAMTCPCGHYDYISSTKETLSEALACTMLRYAHTYTQIQFVSLLFYSRKEISNKMRLYRHSARCPVALRVFLDCNPMYWCFVSIAWNDFVDENIRVLQTNTGRINAEITNIIRMGAIEDRTLARYLQRVPIPPAPYVFSYRQ